MSLGAITNRWQEFAGRLRFPQLFLLTLLLFLGDLAVPDLIPLVDEMLLGLITLMLGMWKQRKSQDAPSRQEVTVEKGRIEAGSGRSGNTLDL